MIKENKNDYLRDINCQGCSRNCDTNLYYRCANNNYCFYKTDNAWIMRKNNMEFFSKIFYGAEDKIVNDLNRFFQENKNIRIDKICNISLNNQELKFLIIFEKIL